MHFNGRLTWAQAPRANRRYVAQTRSEGVRISRPRNQGHSIVIADWAQLLPLADQPV
jgi:hypothetical protein